MGKNKKASPFEPEKKGQVKSDQISTRDTIKRLLSYLGYYKFRLAVVVVCIIISSAVIALSSVFIQSLIDDFITPMLASHSTDFSALSQFILKIMVVFACGTVAAYLYNRFMVVIAQGILKKIRDDMFSHMQKLPIRYFDTHTHGDIMSHYTNDTDTLRQMISQSIPMMFSSCISIVAVVIAMLYISLWLTFIVFGFIILIVVVIGKVAGMSGKYFIKQQASLGTVDGYIEEMINGQKVVKVFCYENRAKQSFDLKNTELYRNSSTANSYANVLMPIMNNIGYVMYVVIAIVGGIMGIASLHNIALSGTAVITLGAIAGFLQLSRTFINPLAQVSQQLNFIVMALAGAGRIFALLDQKPESDEGNVTLVRMSKQEGQIKECSERTGCWAWKRILADGSAEYIEMLGSIVFEHVDFGYDENKKVLHDVNLYAEPGQKVAFVGATGAGKTTITNLINRFYDIQEGTITYDGIDIKSIKKADLRRSLGVVLQDVNLFTGTVMDNIRYGKLDASDEECIAAAKLANADGFISMLPEGYQTILSGDGSGLSQGQRQLISIARAAVANPPVMILDEATSSIDTRTEAIVQSGMDALMKGRTVFVIAHRLSTVQNSDVIMVLEQGHIIERGSHDRLIQEQGRYYQLYTGAFELE